MLSAGNIIFYGYSRGSPGELGTSNDSGVIENVDFQGFRIIGCYVVGALGGEASIIIQYYLVPCRLSTDPEIQYLTLKGLNGHFT